jgi:hypothetical protein
MIEVTTSERPTGQQPRLSPTELENPPLTEFGCRRNMAPQAQEISADMSENSVIPERMQSRRQAYQATLQQPEKLQAYYIAFASGLARPHQSQLPPEPNPWKELQRHPVMAPISML